VVGISSDHFFYGYLSDFQEIIFGCLVFFLLSLRFNNQIIMAIFKDHKIDIRQLLCVIPEALLSHLSGSTKVDYYSKVLQSKKLFYLLMYGLLENNRLSQRTLEDTFNDPVFKMLFNLAPDESVWRSSISERLSKIDTSFFKQIYECIYEQFSKSDMSAGQLKYNLILVDSMPVHETSSKLAEGFYSNQQGRKAVKYTMAFDGVLPCLSKMFTAPACSSEDIALPQVVHNHIKQETDHQNIYYLLDRGLQSTGNMQSFNKEQITFIARAKENRKYMELESLVTDSTNTDIGNPVLLKDSIAYLYTGKAINNKKGKVHYREELVEESFRLVITRSKEDEDKEFWFITNNFEMSTKEIADAYRGADGILKFSFALSGRNSI
jgi:transposase